MSGETERDVSGWTVDTLRALMDERDRRYGERFKAQEKAVDNVAKETKEKFASVNEFRGALSDQTNTFIPRAEALATHDRLAGDIKALTDRLNLAEGNRQGVRLSAGVLVTVVTTAALLLGAALTAVTVLAR